MSFSYSPKLVTDGLVLCLDAANIKSYPGSGTAWNDIGRSGAVGTFRNGPTFDSGNGGSIVLDGANDYIDLGTVPQMAPGTRDFTIDFWINPTNWNSTYSPVFTTTVTYGFWIGKNATNFVLRAYNVIDDLQTTTFPTANVWTNVVIRRSVSTANIYYNNTSIISGTVTTNYVEGVSEISRDGAIGNNVFNGKISNFRYYSKALTSQEMTQNYNTIKSRYGL